jgi:thiazole synthase ThiGH ThiG subunit
VTEESNGVATLRKHLVYVNGALNFVQIGGEETWSVPVLVAAGQQDRSDVAHARATGLTALLVARMVARRMEPVTGTRAKDANAMVR